MDIDWISGMVYSSVIGSSTLEEETDWIVYGCFSEGISSSISRTLSSASDMVVICLLFSLASDLGLVNDSIVSNSFLLLEETLSFETLDLLESKFDSVSFFDIS